MDADKPEKEIIQYDDFAKLDLRVGTVLEVSDHPNADKLIVMKVDLGDEQRQIIAGLRGHCSHEELLGSQIVVVANLAPRKMRGMESQGMLLAATWTKGDVFKVAPVAVASETPAGASIS